MKGSFLHRLPMGRRLAVRRVALDLSQAQLARLAAVSEAAIGRAEKDHHQTGIETLARLHLTLCDLEDEAARQRRVDRPDQWRWQAVVLAAARLREGQSLDVVVGGAPTSFTRPARPFPRTRATTSGTTSGPTPRTTSEVSPVTSLTSSPAASPAEACHG